MKTKVLFICIHNSARSQMAEAWLNCSCGDFFEAQSAKEWYEEVCPRVASSARR